MQTGTQTTAQADLPSCRWFPLLRRNDSVSQNEDVRYLQRTLNANGYSVTTDGGFGAKTEAAVIEFQKRKKIKADGVVGAKTWEQLGVCTNVF